MKRPIQILCSLPFLIALLMAPASDSQSQSTFESGGASPGMAASLADSFEAEPEKTAEFRSKARSLQEQGDFEGAVIYLERALRLDRENAELKSALADARKLTDQRATVLKSLPADPAQRDSALSKKLDEAIAAEQSGDREKARKLLNEVWLADASFRDAGQRLKNLDNAPVKPVVVAKADVPVVKIEPLDEVKESAPSAIAALPKQDEKVSKLPPINLPKSSTPIEVASVAKSSVSEKKSEDNLEKLPPVVVSESKLKTETAKAEKAEPVKKVSELLKDAQADAKKGDFDSARTTYEKVLTLEPSEKKALAGLKDLAKKEMASLSKSSASEEKSVKPADKEKEESFKIELETERASTPPPVEVSQKPVTSSENVTVDKLPPLQTNPVAVANVTSEKDMARKADALASAGHTESALKAFDEAKKAVKSDEKEIASATLDVAEKTAVRPAVAAVNVKDPKAVSRLDSLYAEGIALHEKGDLRAAREIMGEILLIDPQDSRAQTFLDTTAEEWEARLGDERALAEASLRETEGEQKLNSSITIETKRPTPLADFLNNLSFISGINFAVADGVEASVTGKFTDQPLKDVLDTVLGPNGLKWERTGGDIIVVSSDLQSQPFSLKPETMDSVKALMESGQLQKMVWPPDGVPAIKGQELTLDERSGLLLATDSRDNLQRLEGMLAGLSDSGMVGLTTSIYKIDPKKGEKVKALLEAILGTQSESPEDLNRKIIVDEGDLIVYASQRDIAKVEELLKDENLIEKIAARKLQLQKFSLMPKQPLQMDKDLAEAFFRNVEEQIRIFLYSQTGQTLAAKDGRKMWADPATMQITLTDFPENLELVGEFISSLEQLEQRQEFKVIYVKNKLADDMAAELQNLFGLTSPLEMGPTGPVYIVTKNLRRDQDYKFRDLTLRVRRVNENDLADDRDDSVEVLARTGTYSETLTLQEYDSQFIGDYEVVAEEITPSGTPGEGRATIQIRYIPPPGQVPSASDLSDGGLTQTPDTTEPIADLDIQANSDLNALIIRYQNPDDLKQIQELIDLLDKPVPQVSIMTKMVEVNETRAKELSAEWTINDLQEFDFGLSDSILDTRFAQDADEFISHFEPLPETVNSANLLKGATVIEMVTGGTSTLGLQLRALEAEGIINVVNGPRLTIKNGEEGTLTITDFNTFSRGAPGTVELTQGGSGNDGGNDDGGQTGQNNPNTGQNNGGDGGTGQGGGNNNGDGNNTNNVAGQHVDMSLTPQVTSADLIEVEIDVILTDNVSNLGGIFYVNSTSPLAAFSQYAVTNSLGVTHPWGVTQRQKDITTIASVKSGGTIVLGGWLSERQQLLTSGVPVLRNLPYVGKLFFNKQRDTLDRTNMLIFLTVQLVPID